MNYFYDPNLYDLDYLERIEDIYFYLDKSKEFRNKKVLELGSGTGRISIPLHNDGVNLTCIEKSPNLIKKAKEKCSDLNILNLDFTSFCINKKFDLIIMPFNALQEVYDIKSINNCFKSIQKHMKKGAKFIFDVNNPNIDELSREKDSVMVYDVFKAYYENGILKRFNKNINYKNNEFDLIDIIVEDSINYDSISNIATYTMYYSSSDAKFYKTFKLKHKMFFPNDLEKMLNSLNFQIIKKYGDFDRSNFNINSPSQIYVCEIE